jgi:hypothetical protein
MAITETTESIKGPVGRNMPRVDVHEKGYWCGHLHR